MSKIKLTYIRPVGTYLNVETNREVNIKKGWREGRSVDLYFYLYRGERIFIAESDFRNKEKFTKALDPLQKEFLKKEAAIKAAEAKMKLEVIYSHAKGQDIAVFAFKREYIATKQAFIDFCLNALDVKYSFSTSMFHHFGNQTMYDGRKPFDGEPDYGAGHQGVRESETPEVVKLSGLLYGAPKGYKAPAWWDDQFGKVYFHEVLEKLR